MTPTDNRILRQYGKKLSQPDICLMPSKDGDFQIASLRQAKCNKKAISIDAKCVRHWQRADLLEDHGGKLVLSGLGRAWLRRQQAVSDPFMAQHQLRVEENHSDVPMVRRNVSISPLAWLRAHANDKRLGIDDIEFDAGELFARDFHIGEYSCKQTMHWQQPVIFDGGARSDFGQAPVHVLDARRRLSEAMDCLGPGIGEIMLAICCYEQGLEACEKAFAIPRRSAKMILKLGLLRLTVFYGLQSAKAAAASFRMR